MPLSATYRPAPRILELGEGFYDAVAPARFPLHRLRFRNQRWAARVGLGDLDASEWERHFAAFAPLPDNLPEPLALRYHGHQFRVYNPDLGDGRGFLAAQLLDAEDGRLLDLGTKGSGRTPWSRDGDGRLTLKGGVREVLATEMLEALGVPTSKSVSLFETGEQLWRGDEPSPTRSSVLVRLGHSHVRFGSFQRHLALGDRERVARLLDYSVRHYAPHLAPGAGEDVPSAFLREVTLRSARLCAAWMAAGFVHGVLNSDNMNVTGESFDYGPYRFLPTYDPSFTAAYFDHSGLYAYGRQPDSVLWNLQRLADTLIELSSRDALARALDSFVPEFFRAWRERLLARLGVRPLGDERDQDLLSLCRAFLQESQVGYDRFFFDWYGGVASAARAAASPAAEKYRGAGFVALRAALDAYAPAAPERLALPYFQRPAPCSLLIDEIEALWAAIAERDDWSPFEAKVADIRHLGEATGLAARA
ncbi:MAG: protein adenylyltransferase SelO [Thermodesulfobacteriota bacterium]